MPSSAATPFLTEAKRLKAAGRLDDALEQNRRAVAAAPDSGIAEHNLAATLGDLSRFAEAADAARRAIGKGTDAPETWLVLARALQGGGLLDEADRAFADAVARRPGYVAAHRDLAQLRWMRSADISLAVDALDAALRDDPAAEGLALVRARMLATAGDPSGAADALDRLLRRVPGSIDGRIAAAQAAATLGRADAQLAHATAAFRLAPDRPDAARAMIKALLHDGQPAEAERLALGMLARRPADQGLLALLGTAWRLTGDPRHQPLFADERLVSATPIDTPDGWPDLAAFLAALAAVLRPLHTWRTHPLEQSVRHGSQTQSDLSRSDDPIIAALFRALDAPIRRHIAALGAGGDPLRTRATDDYRIAGAWSVLLPPGGFHTDHVHPEGWLSSAFYVELPDAVERGHEGWLALGRPGVPTRPALPPYRHLRPRPGLLALFPSYLWHGTEPFAGDRPRLTVAFDVVPA